MTDTASTKGLNMIVKEWCDRVLVLKHGILSASRMSNHEDWNYNDTDPQAAFALTVGSGIRSFEVINGDIQLEGLEGNRYLMTGATTDLIWIDPVRTSKFPLGAEGAISERYGGH